MGVTATRGGFQAETGRNGWKQVHKGLKGPKRFGLTPHKGQVALLKNSILGGILTHFWPTCFLVALLCFAKKIEITP